MKSFRMLATAFGLCLAFSRVSGSPAPVVLQDDVGRCVTITAEPRRIVSLAPSNTEILYALGAGKRIVGVTEYTDYPAGAKAHPVVGSFDKPSLERIAALKPDLILSGGGAQRELVLRLERLGYTVLVLYPEDMKGVFRDIELIGRSVGADGSRRARRLVSRLQSRLGAIERRARKLFGDHGPVVYFELWRDPLQTAGRLSFIHEIITLAGGRNLAGDIKDTFPRVSAETVVFRRPEVILVGYDLPQSKAVESFRRRPGWADVPAVRNGNIWTNIPADLLLRPGPRLVDGCEAIFQRLQQVHR